MFKNVGGVLKTLSALLIVVTIIVGAAFFISSYSDYSDYKQFIEYATANGGSSIDSAVRYSDIAYAAQTSMKYTAMLTIASLISSLVLCGFGEIIIILDDIRNSLSSRKEHVSITVDENDN